MNVSGGVLDNDGVDYSVQWTGPLSWQCLHAAVLQCCRRGLVGQFKYFHSKHKYDHTATLSPRHTAINQINESIPVANQLYDSKNLFIN